MKPVRIRYGQCSLLRCLPELLRCLPELLRCLPELLRCLPELLRCLPELLRCLPELLRLVGGLVWECHCRLAKGDTREELRIRRSAASLA